MCLPDSDLYRRQPGVKIIPTSTAEKNSLSYLTGPAPHSQSEFVPGTTAGLHAECCFDHKALHASEID